ncbi:unnamed protein product, partial [Mesorhabditis belari]|uniref:Uncharacterized protein n=1 Tax=Mesorhabditis belari TaxID=2138241 RepID=A0AAF3FJS1_9BILA
MGLHSTLDNFDHNMVAQLKSWKGCVSLSLFVDAPEESTAPQPMTPFQLMAELSLIRFFQQHSITNVTVHQVFEQWNDENGFRCADYRLERLKVLPEELKSILDLQEQPSMGEEDLYPINVMRNIARMFIPKFSLTTLADSHFRYSKNFSENILETIRSTRVSVNLRRALFVYPSFEGLPNDKNHIPNTRNELRDAILNGTAQSFMKDANPMAHFLRDLDQWLHNENDVGIGDSGYLHSEWDPQFVSLNSLPFHDERFPYMQADNLNQRWELCRSGYRFMILHGAFAIHPGIRPGDDSFRKKMRRKMWKVIDKAISDFIAFIESTYPQTYRKCPDFEIGKPWKQPLPSHDSNATESIHQNRPISRKQTLQTYLNAMVALRKAKQDHFGGIEFIEEAIPDIGKP